MDTGNGVQNKGEDSWCQLSLASGVFLLFWVLCVIIGCVVSNLSKNNKRILGKIDMCSDSTLKHIEITGGQHVNIGILGAGKIAGVMADTINKMDNVELYAVGSRTLEKANAFAREFDIDKAYGSYEELVSDDAIDLIDRKSVV